MNKLLIISLLCLWDTVLAQQEYLQGTWSYYRQYDNYFSESMVYMIKDNSLIISADSRGDYSCNTRATFKIENDSMIISPYDFFLKDGNIGYTKQHQKGKLPSYSISLDFFKGTKNYKLQALNTGISRYDVPKFILNKTSDEAYFDCGKNLCIFEPRGNVIYVKQIIHYEPAHKKEFEKKAEGVWYNLAYIEAIKSYHSVIEAQKKVKKHPYIISIHTDIELDEADYNFSYSNSKNYLDFSKIKQISESEFKAFWESGK